MVLPLSRAVQRRGQSQPHDPWLFTPSGPDWSFLSWGEATARLEELVRALRSAAGERVAFPWRCRGEDWLFDLALQEVGACPVPVRGETAAGLAAEAVARDARLLVGASSACFSSLAPRRVLRDGASQSRRRIDPGDELESRVQRISTGLGEPAGRDIALLHGDLETAAVRSLLSWATLTGAAVVFEPSPARLLGTFRWARPTVLLAGAATRAELLRRLEAARQGPFGGFRTRRLKGRLRGLVVQEAGVPEAGERELWEAAGVALVAA